MPNKESENIIYSPTVLDFVTVAVEFCAFLERETPIDREKWLDRVLKLLPLMYIKASLLPQTVGVNEELPELSYVKGADYVRVATAVSTVVGEEDVYLDVFVEDMKYSERPVSAFVSENIADIYQDVRNFVSAYQHGLAEQMNDALFVCRENFRTYWGQKLVNVLRPLHALYYKDNEDTYLSETDLNRENLWD